MCRSNEHFKKLHTLFRGEVQAVVSKIHFENFFEFIRFFFNGKCSILHTSSIWYFPMKIPTSVYHSKIKSDIEL